MDLKMSVEFKFAQLSEFSFVTVTALISCLVVNHLQKNV